MEYLMLTASKWSRSVCFTLCIFLCTVNLSSQCSLACNGSTQVSLDINCVADVTPEMILNDQASSCPGGIFEVTISNQYGPINGPVNSDYIGQTLYARITDTNSGNSCWGEIILEDKLGPQVQTCPSTFDISCSALAVYPGPTFIDACEGELEPILISEQVANLPCDPAYVKTLIRTYSAVDSDGNFAPNCTVTYNLERLDFDDVNCATQYTVADLGIPECSTDDGALSCDGLWKPGQGGFLLDTDLNGDGIFDKDKYWDDNQNGIPDPEEIGAPTITTEIDGEMVEIPLYPFPDVNCNSVLTYTDINLPEINCVQKIMRLWILREWHCSGEVSDTFPQIIEIVDDTPPVIECPSALEFTTNTIMGATNSSHGSVTCGSSILLPLPSATDDCAADLTVDITYNGGFEKDYDGNTLVVLPMGANIVEYAVYDECYNSSTCQVVVDIQDNTPPVAVCDQYTAVSLTTGGEAFVNATSFDDGSYDDCKTHCMLVRRMTVDSSCSCKVPELCGLDYIGERDGSYYYISNYDVTANIAKNRAEAYGGNVVVFEDQYEEDWLLSQVRPNYSGRFWLGMKRSGNSFVWDNHNPLSYENWLPGKPIGVTPVIDYTVYPTNGNSILVNDGAIVSNVNDMVSNLRVYAGSNSARVNITWDWFADSGSGGFTTEDGINMKLYHYNGTSWNEIYSERYSGTNTTNTIAPYLDVTNTSSYSYTLPNDTGCGVNYFRVAIEDNAFEWDEIEGNFGTNADGSHFDNADVAIDVTTSQCSGDCVMMTPTNQWNDASCYTELPYIIEIKDVCGFSSVAKFCCSDVGTDQMVVFRVVDIFGNYNDCMVNVDIQDKAAPSLICPPNVTVDCDLVFDAQDLTDQFGEPILNDDCGASVSEELINELSNCNLGTLQRVFTATDNGGRTSTCKQTITFENPDPLSGYVDIVCPRDTTIIGCMAPDDLSPDVLGYPEFITQRCGLIGTDWDDEVFTFNTTNGDACFKILRTWDVIDWCQPNLPVWTCTQVIKVTNGVKPVISDLDTLKECVYDSDCVDGFIELTASATDDCTSNSELSWRYTVYAGELGVGPLSLTNPVVDVRGDGNEADASGTYPIGTHVIRWTFFDGCGNATTRDQQFTIGNCKPATAYCINGLAVDLMPMDIDGNGEFDFAMVELWASDFDAGSFHSCGYEVFLSFSADTSDTNINFDCTTRGDQEVQIWASVVGPCDSLIQTFCSSFVNVQDNNNACQGLQPDLVDVGGSIFTETLESVDDVEVRLGGTVLEEFTDTNGEYAFPDMPKGGDYIINPYSNANPLNGVSTLDIVEIQRHILGMEALDSPYKIIAADINNDNTLSTIDLLELRKLILGVYDELPDNDSWRFVDNDFSFLNDENPLHEQFTEDYEIYDLQEDMFIDFVAVKVGDVNNSAVSSMKNARPDARNNATIELEIEDFSYQAGELISVPFTINNKAIDGYQMSLAFDNTALEFVGIEGANIDDSNYRLGENYVNVSYSNPGQALASDQIFTINMIAKADGTTQDLVVINNKTMSAEVYTDGEIKTPVITTKAASSLEFGNLMNTPNPFAEFTNVSLSLEEAGPAEMLVHDAQGRIVYRENMQFDQGENNFRLYTDHLGSQGVYYLTIKTDQNTATIKMVAIK